MPITHVGPQHSKPSAPAPSAKKTNESPEESKEAKKPVARSWEAFELKRKTEDNGTVTPYWERIPDRFERQAKNNEASTQSAKPESVKAASIQTETPATPATENGKDESVKAYSIQTEVPLAPQSTPVASHTKQKQTPFDAKAVDKKLKSTQRISQWVQRQINKHLSHKSQKEDSA